MGVKLAGALPKDFNQVAVDAVLIRLGQRGGGRHQHQGQKKGNTLF